MSRDDRPSSSGECPSGDQQATSNGNGKPLRNGNKSEEQSGGGHAQPATTSSDEAVGSDKDTNTRDTNIDDDEKDASQPRGKPKLAKPDVIDPCPRCSSQDTKFCYYNNYNVRQPRFLCKACQRYWTGGGILRNVPPGSGRRKSKAAAAKSCSDNSIAQEHLAKQSNFPLPIIASAADATLSAAFAAAGGVGPNPMLDPMLMFNSAAAAMAQQQLMGGASLTSMKLPNMMGQWPNSMDLQQQQQQLQQQQQQLQQQQQVEFAQVGGYGAISGLPRSVLPHLTAGGCDALCLPSDPYTAASGPDPSSSPTTRSYCSDDCTEGRRVKAKTGEARQGGSSSINTGTNVSGGSPIAGHTGYQHQQAGSGDGAVCVTSAHPAAEAAAAAAQSLSDHLARQQQAQVQALQAAWLQQAMSGWSQPGLMGNPAVAAAAAAVMAAGGGGMGHTAAGRADMYSQHQQAAAALAAVNAQQSAMQHQLHAAHMQAANAACMGQQHMQGAGGNPYGMFPGAWPYSGHMNYGAPGLAPGGIAASAGMLAGSGSATHHQHHHLASASTPEALMAQQLLSSRHPGAAGGIPNMAATAGGLPNMAALAGGMPNMAAMAGGMPNMAAMAGGMPGWPGSGAGLMWSQGAHMGMGMQQPNGGMVEAAAGMPSWAEALHQQQQLQQHQQQMQMQLQAVEGYPRA